MESIASKTCKACRISQPLSAFYLKSSGKHLVNSECKTCAKERLRRWYAENREAFIEVKRARDAKYREAHREQRRAWHTRNTERLQAEREAQKAERAAQLRASGDDGALAALLVNAHKKDGFKPQARRLKRIREYHSVTDLEWAALCEWFGDRCLCCGATGHLTRDHVIPIVLGGKDHLTNVQPLCSTCNLSKGTAIRDYRDATKLSGFLAALHLTKAESST